MSEAGDGRPELDLGHGVTARFVGPARSWAEHDPPEHVGAIIDRPGTHEDGSDCSGVVFWWAPPGNPDGRNLWELVSEDPLTLSPSIACSHPGCDFHGYVREGRWEPA